MGIRTSTLSMTWLLVLCASVASGSVSAGSAAASAVAAQDTCRGLPATISKSFGIVHGTPGDDVIAVSDQIKFVFAGAGNDVICLVGTEKTRNVSIRAEDGNDVIDTSQASRGEVYTTLGTGADSFIGGSAKDFVTAGGPDYSVQGPGDDTVATGAGADYVSEVAGAAVRTGPGRDEILLRVDPRQPSTDVPMEFGRGRDVLHFSSHAVSDEVDADLRQHRLSAGGISVPIESVEDLFITAPSVRLSGDDRANRFRVEACESTLIGRGGQDSFQLGRLGDDGPFEDCARPSSRMAGQDGDDRLVGSRGPDTLLGGAGRDRADGREGRDTCRTEVTEHCEG